MSEYKFNPIWNEVGVSISRELTIEELLHKAGMNFEVELGRMYTSFIPKDYSVEKTEDGFKLIGEGNKSGMILHKKGVEVPGIYSTYRTDTFDVLGVVGAKYNVIQNREVMDFFMNIINNLDIPAKDVKLDRAGILYKGAQLFMTVELPSYKIGNDDIAKYLLFVSSHDGSKAISVCFTDIRVFCSNMLNNIITTAQNKISIRHTANAKSVMNIAENIIHKSTNYSKSVKELLESYQKIELTYNDIRYLTSCLIWNDAQIKYLEGVDYIQSRINTDIVSTRSYNKYIAYMNTIKNGIGQTSEYENTLYWWYNGILAYITHVHEYKNKEDKMDSIIAGTASNLARKAFDLCVEYVNTQYLY